jgi:hypothetical protein
MAGPIARGVAEGHVKSVLMNGNLRLVCFVVMGLGPGACAPGNLFGLPGPQDGTWQSTPTQVLAIGAKSYILQINQDRIVRVNVNGVEWTVQLSFPASRLNTQAVWKVVAQAPATSTGTLIPVTSTEITVDVALQLDGTLLGTASEGIATIPGIASIPTATFQILMRRI